MKNTIISAVAAALVGISTIAASPTFANSNQVNIYSYRQPELIAPVLEAFSEETGIKTRVLNLQDGMVERLRAEGRNSPADVILTIDIGRLMDIKDGGVTQPVISETINANIPEQYRDPDNNWFGLTLRARVVLASRERVEQNNITYAELADPKWNDRICIRSGQHPYNIALFASIIANEGEAATKEWLIGLKNNLARSPVGNDRAQVQGIYSGECDLAIGYTYYMGLMRTNERNPEQKEWEASVKVLFPDQNGRGTHVNVSGMAMAKNAPNQENALALMEFLSSPNAQQIYAEQVFEYPISPDAKPSEITSSYGELVADPLSIVEVARWRAAASRLVDQVGFNE